MNSAADELDRLTANKDTAAPLSGLAAEVRAVIAQGEKKKLAQAKLNALVLKIQLVKSSALPSAQAAADSDFKEIVKHHADAANASREHWMKVAQMVLLNLLLPVLTALLGYVFASRNSGR